MRILLPFLLSSLSISLGLAQEHWSGIYPHLASFNKENECGTGAVVPWADRLWVVTYAPHSPRGSSDKLYEINKDLELTIRPESIGGTPANRMIHRESKQLFIGPYAIDAERNVRVIPYKTMTGRPTANARHLTDPKNKIYYATMEEGLYEVDVHSLAVKTLYQDTHVKPPATRADLPGYHGKGLYSGQGRVVYANNGENSAVARRDPFVPSGALAQWDGSDWSMVLRTQFTEVTGPGGIEGNANPATDPIWSIGWDAKSLILMVLDQRQWHRFRLPKASHSYDGAHGWNTEWPRIREIGEEDLLMTMHGMFWRFPRDFRPGNTGGIAPRSSYLKVIGDFCRWGDRVVLGCDDTAKAEFLNKRKAKGHIPGPQSQSNLWFVPPERLDQLGPVIGRGAIWLDEDIEPGALSDPFLFGNFSRRTLHVASPQGRDFRVVIEIGDGQGNWRDLAMATFGQGESGRLSFRDDEPGSWIRLHTPDAAKGVTATFTYGDPSARPEQNLAPFAGLATTASSNPVGALLRARDGGSKTLSVLTADGYYVMSAADGGLKLEPGPAKDAAWTRKNLTVPERTGVLEIDQASVLYIDDKQRRYRIPKGPAAYDQSAAFGRSRLCREVATERDLFNCHGTFYELPAENAAGFARVRPVASHDLRLQDYCSYRGLLVLSGVDAAALASTVNNRHLIRSADGKAAVWVGAIDDLWQLGKPVGRGGPWFETAVKAGELSDPYLLCGYDQKTLSLSSDTACSITAEVDLSGMGLWKKWKSFDVPADESLNVPVNIDGYWIRFRSNLDAVASAQLAYE